MSNLSDIHTHTSYCDGKNTADEMAKCAFDLGFEVYGFSGHGYTEFDCSYCMSRENTEKYKAHVAKIKDVYKGKMTVLCGVEADVFQEGDYSDFDYVIGSCHYVKLGENYYPLDLGKDNFLSILEEHFEGDFEKLARQYYKDFARLFGGVGADVVGHFDIVTKYDELCRFKKGDEYYAAAFAACDELLKYGVPFEVNVGAITRGYRTTPYPDEKILRHLRECGGEIVVTGDTHRADKLGENLDVGIAYAKRCGFTYRLILTDKGWKKEAL